jgi:hypothetical protein
MKKESKEKKKEKTFEEKTAFDSRVKQTRQFTVVMK